MATELLTRPSRGQSLSSSENDPYHKGMTGVYDYPYVLDGTPPPAMPPTAGYPLPGTANSTPPPNPWPKRVGIGAAVIVSITAALIGGYMAGRMSSELPSTTPATATALPGARPFDSTDKTWCAEFVRSDDSVIDRGKANGWPRNIAGKDVPATAWTAEERAANAQFRQYIALFGDGSMRDLAARSHNPALTMLMNTQISATDTAVQALDAGTYQPSDYQELLSIAGTGTAIRDICEEISKG